MALQKNTSFKGIEITNGYYKIIKIEGDKNYLNTYVGLFADKDATDYLELTSYYFKPSILDTASNFYKQGYEYLKTLDIFKNATDVLENGQSAT
jgi:hypothetical protein